MCVSVGYKDSHDSTACLPHELALWICNAALEQSVLDDNVTEHKDTVTP